MKKLLSITLAAFMALSVLAGCSGGASSTGGKASSGTGTASTSTAGEPAASGNDIRAYFASSPETIDPTKNSSMDGGTYLTHLFQGLFRYKWDATGVELGDAASYEVSEDGLTWTFTLRDDIKWSDGQPVTAKDYEYAWKRLMDPDTASPYAGDLGNFILNASESLEGKVAPDEVGVKAIDDKTFEVKLTGPTSFFDQVAAFPVFAPVRQDIIEANGDSWWTNPETYITNGPFVMKSFTLDQNMVVVPSETYYDRDKIVPTSITFQFLADENAALAAFRAGEIDLSNAAPPAEIKALREEGVLDVKTQLGTYYITFNTEVEPFNNPLVRKALSLAIDREYLSKVIMNDTYQPATSYVGPGFIDVKDGEDFRTVGGEFISPDYEKNMKLAKEALAEAGYPDGKDFPTVEYMYNTSDIHKPVAEVLAKSWEDVLGVKTNLVNQEWNVFQDSRRKGNFEVARNGWVADWNDPSTMLTIFITGGGNNDGKYSNSEFDAFMTASNATSDRAEHIKALHDAEKVLMDDWACGPLMHYTMNFIVNPKLTNWHFMPIGYTMLHEATIAS